jgi:hypothetical protein
MTDENYEEDIFDDLLVPPVRATFLSGAIRIPLANADSLPAMTMTTSPRLRHPPLQPRQSLPRSI